MENTETGLMTKKPAKPTAGPKKVRGPGVINRDPTPDRKLRKDIPRSIALQEMGRRIQAAMLKKGWSQVELAAAAEKFMPEGKNFYKSAVSAYVRGERGPHHLHLHAMCQALGVKREDLIVPHAVRTAEDHHGPGNIRFLSDGNAWLQVNQATTMEIASKVLALLKQGLPRRIK